VKTLKLLVAASAGLCSATAFAGLVDLSTWISEDTGSSDSAPNWTVQGPNNDTVFQSVNSRPSVFFDPLTTSTLDTALSGEITVQTGSDDDFIGFVLGYDSGEMGTTGTDFILIDWKQGTQPSGSFGTGFEGLAVSRVTNADSDHRFWGRDTATSGSPGSVTEIARGATLGSTGWADFQTYQFELVFNQTLIQVVVDGSLELSITAADAGVAAFDDGSFGFYNYSQGSVLYASIRQDPAPPPPPPNPTPAPGTLLLLAAGLAGCRFAAKRSS